MYRDTGAFAIGLVAPGISILMLIALVVLMRMGWYRRVRIVVERYLSDEEYSVWLLVGLLLISVFSFGVFAGYVLWQAWW